MSNIPRERTTHIEHLIMLREWVRNNPNSPDAQSVLGRLNNLCKHRRPYDRKLVFSDVELVIMDYCNNYGVNKDELKRNALRKWHYEEKEGVIWNGL